jgi:hypothetical protein
VDKEEEACISTKCKSSPIYLALGKCSWSEKLSVSITYQLKQTKTTTVSAPTNSHPVFTHLVFALIGRLCSDGAGEGAIVLGSVWFCNCKEHSIVAQLNQIETVLSNTCCCSSADTFRATVNCDGAKRTKIKTERLILK